MAGPSSPVRVRRLAPVARVPGDQPMLLVSQSTLPACYPPTPLALPGLWQPPTTQALAATVRAVPVATTWAHSAVVPRMSHDASRLAFGRFCATAGSGPFSAVVHRSPVLASRLQATGSIDISYMDRVGRRVAL